MAQPLLSLSFFLLGNGRDISCPGAGVKGFAKPKMSPPALALPPGPQSHPGAEEGGTKCRGQPFWKQVGTLVGPSWDLLERNLTTP